MVNFPDGGRLVAMFAEPAPHRHGLWMLDEMRGLCVTRVESEHERGAAWRAHGSLAVGLVENDSTLRESVQVGSDGG